MTLTIDIPPGLCHCGCGQRTRIARSTRRERGWIKGEPIRYVHGHHGRLLPSGWVEKPGPLETPCKVWTGTIASDGYPRRRGEDTTMVHRQRWIARNGPVPAGMELEHRCQDRACVEEGHLDLITVHVKVLRSRLTKLAAEQVAEIRSLAGCCTQREIARRFGIGQSQVSRIVNRQSRWEVA